MQVEAFSNEFDATRSTGYLCAATVKNFEEVSIIEMINQNRHVFEQLEWMVISKIANLLAVFWKEKM